MVIPDPNTDLIRVKDTISSTEIGSLIPPQSKIHPRFHPIEPSSHYTIRSMQADCPRERELPPAGPELRRWTDNALAFVPQTSLAATLDQVLQAMGSGLSLLHESTWVRQADNRLSRRVVQDKFVEQLEVDLVDRVRLEFSS